MDIIVYANRGALDSKTVGFWSETSFNLRLFAIEVAYQVSEFWRALNLRLLHRKVGGFEDLMEKEFSRSVEQQLGFAMGSQSEDTKKSAVG